MKISLFPAKSSPIRCRLLYGSHNVRFAALTGKKWKKKLVDTFEVLGCAELGPISIFVESVRIF